VLPFCFAFPHPHGFFFIGFAALRLRLGFTISGFGMNDQSRLSHSCRFVQLHTFGLMCLAGVVLIVNATRSPRPVSRSRFCIMQSRHIWSEAGRLSKQDLSLR
jgi:hypothetical protein